MGGGNEEVIELSVEETNALRAELGLAPLRGAGIDDKREHAKPSPSSSSERGTGGDGVTGGSGVGGGDGGGGDKEELSLSVDETNALRARLGLPPLRTSGPSSAAPGRKPSEAIHAPAANRGEERAARERIEEARVRREAERGVERLAELGGGKADDDDDDDGGGGGDASDWAAKMRAGGASSSAAAAGKGGGDKKTKKKKGKGGKKAGAGGGSDSNRISVPGEDEEETARGYGESDLSGLAVSHSASDFAAGTSTIMTLADADVLADGDDANVLENVDLADSKRSEDNLRRKRMVEMGVGRAGGYAGFDDDEFEELGGSQAALRTGREVGGGAGGEGEDGGAKGGRKIGFRIGQSSSGPDSKKDKSDLFAAETGAAISLQTGTTDKHQSDFLTAEEIEAEEAEREAKEARRREKEAKKREKKMFKKMKKREKKEKKNRRREEESDDEEEKKDQGGDAAEGIGGAGKGGSLLDDLEASAPAEDKKSGKRRKRRRRGDDTDSDDDEAKPQPKSEPMVVDSSAEPADAVAVAVKKEEEGDREKEQEEDDDAEAMRRRRAKYDRATAKGEARTRAVFGARASEAKPGAKPGAKPEGNGGGGGKVKAEEADAEVDDGEDDAFLNAALAKARRLKRLKELAAGGSAGAGKEGGKQARGADAVAHAVQSIKQEADAEMGSSNGEGKGSGKLTFEFDETREFTRALRARERQAGRGRAAPAKAKGVEVASAAAKKKAAAEGEEDGGGKVKAEDVHEEDVDMAEMAERMSDDEAGGGPAPGSGGGDDDGQALETTASNAGVGRGLSAALSLLRRTGEITGKNAGREELRGRAKDERTYEDYDALDLRDVVRVDTTGLGGRPHDKDVELANREVSLEYRDEHGRLLTRKEAYRNLCYQFHGHGSSKKNEERRLRQIRRERAEAKAAAEAGRGRGGTLGVLKATQRATGKAFVVHKT